jgi:hypothetical protein
LDRKKLANDCLHIPEKIILINTDESIGRLVVIYRLNEKNEMNYQFEKFFYN